MGIFVVVVVVVVKLKTLWVGSISETESYNVVKEK